MRAKILSQNSSLILPKRDDKKLEISSHFRGLSINKKILETKREVIKTIFQEVFQVYQKYQDGILYQLNIFQLKKQILPRVFYPLLSFNSLISFCILPILCRLNKKPYNENEKEARSIISANEFLILKKAKKLPLNPADHKIILSLSIEYSNFKISNLFIFILAYNIFNIIKSFSFYVVIKPSVYPFRNFIFGLPSDRYSFWIKTADISKLFYSKAAFFKCIFKLFISHFLPLVVNYISNYSKKSKLYKLLLLTNKLIILYNCNTKTNFINLKEPLNESNNYSI